VARHDHGRALLVLWVKGDGAKLVLYNYEVGVWRFSFITVQHVLVLMHRGTDRSHDDNDFFVLVSDTAAFGRIYCMAS
jgi:hypothetical protein